MIGCFSQMAPQIPMDFPASFISYISEKAARGCVAARADDEHDGYPPVI